MSARITQKRIAFLDIAKGIGMLLVIWGHIRETGISNAMVYAYHMPLFFFLSGMLYNADKYRSVIELIRRRVRTILIPYAVFSVLTWLVWVAYNKALGNSVESYWWPLLQTIISQGSGGYLVHNSPLWFVTCLFCVEILYFYISKYPLRWNLFLCIMLAVVGNLMIRSEKIPLRNLPWSFDMALCAIPFYMTGNLLAERFGNEKLRLMINKKKLLSVLFIVLSLCVLFAGARLNGPVSMGHRKLNMVYVFYPLAFLGIAMHLSIAALLTESKNVVISFVRWIGEYSFNVMAVQTPIKGVVLVLLSKLLHKSVGELSDKTGYSLIAFAVTVVVVTAVVAIINWAVAKGKEMWLAHRRESSL